MKVLIGIGCCLFASIIKTLIGTLGAIPTILLYGSTFALAKYLCAAWDYHKMVKTIETQGAGTRVKKTTKRHHPRHLKQ